MEIRDLRRIAILNWARRFPRCFQMRMERVCPRVVLLKKRALKKTPHYNDVH